jgi:hypothetical protein
VLPKGVDPLGTFERIQPSVAIQLVNESHIEHCSRDIVVAADSAMVVFIQRCNGDIQGLSPAKGAAHLFEEAIPLMAAAKIARAMAGPQAIFSVWYRPQSSLLSEA